MTTSCVESNWVTELGTLQYLGEEITPLLTALYMIYYSEEVLTFNLVG